MKLSSLLRQAFFGTSLALVSIGLIAAPIGCSQAQQTRVAQDIVNWTPALTTAVNTVGATASILDPAAAGIFDVATTGFGTAAALLTQYAKAYLANPTASALADLQLAVTTLQQNANSALLQTAGIKDQNSQRLALAAINGLATIVATILGLVQSISSKTALNQMSHNSTIKYAQVRKLMDEERMQLAADRLGAQDSAIASHGRITPSQFFSYEAQHGF